MENYRRGNVCCHCRTIELYMKKTTLLTKREVWFFCAIIWGLTNKCLKYNIKIVETLVNLSRKELVFYMDNKAALKMIEEEFIFWSKLGFGTDPPLFDEKGNHILYESLEKNKQYHKEMAETGVKIHSCTISNGWMGDNRYDFKTPLEVLETVMSANPDTYYIPRFRLNPPTEWLRNNPEAVYVYENGPRDKEEVQKLVGGEWQEYMPWTPDELRRITEMEEQVRNREYKIGQVSFSSPKWLDAAGDYTRRLIDVLEQSKYADRIIGYHFGTGKCGETHMWGDSADFGTDNRKAFFEWALEKYGGERKLKERWNMDKLCWENVPLPTNRQRYLNTSDLAQFFHMDKESANYVDYNLYRRDMAYKTAEYFGKIIKEKTGKLVVCFHGYIMHSGADYHGHTDLAKILDSPYVDILCAPKSYYRNELGEPCGSYCVPMSVNRKKLWIDEIDIRNNEKVQKSIDDFIAILWREFLRNVVAGSALWWMDLGSGWYSDRRVLAAVSEMYALKKRINGKVRKSISEILLVADEENLMYITQDYAFHLRSMQDMECETSMIGAPHDMYRLKDLENIELGQYKVIIFMNTFKLGMAQWERIKEKIRPGATLIWSYAPGIMGDRFDIGNVKKITGFEIAEHVKKGGEIPYVEIIKEGGIRCEMTYKERKTVTEYAGIPPLDGMPADDAVAVASTRRKDGGTSIFSCVPPINRQFVRRACESAGCHMYAPTGHVVYADSRVVGIFAKDKIAGVITFRQKETFEDIINNRKYENTDCVKADRNYAVFLMEEPEEKQLSE